MDDVWINQRGATTGRKRRRGPMTNADARTPGGMPLPPRLAPREEMDAADDEARRKMAEYAEAACCAGARPSQANIIEAKNLADHGSDHGRYGEPVIVLNDDNLTASAFMGLAVVLATEQYRNATVKFTSEVGVIATADITIGVGGISDVFSDNFDCDAEGHDAREAGPQKRILGSCGMAWYKWGICVLRRFLRQNCAGAHSEDVEILRRLHHRIYEDVLREVDEAELPTHKERVIRDTGLSRLFAMFSVPLAPEAHGTQMRGGAILVASHVLAVTINSAVMSWLQLRAHVDLFVNRAERHPSGRVFEMEIFDPGIYEHIVRWEGQSGEENIVYLILSTYDRMWTLHVMRSTYRSTDYRCRIPVRYTGNDSKKIADALAADGVEPGYYDSDDRRTWISHRTRRGIESIIAAVLRDTATLNRISAREAAKPMDPPPNPGPVRPIYRGHTAF